MAWLGERTRLACCIPRPRGIHAATQGVPNACGRPGCRAGRTARHARRARSPCTPLCIPFVPLILKDGIIFVGPSGHSTIIPKCKKSAELLLEPSYPGISRRSCEFVGNFFTKVSRRSMASKGLCPASPRRMTLILCRSSCGISSSSRRVPLWKISIAG